MNKKFILALLVTVGLTSAYITYSKKTKSNSQWFASKETSGLKTNQGDVDESAITSKTELLDNKQNLQTSKSNIILARVNGVDLNKEQLAAKIKAKFNADIDKIDESTRNAFIKDIVLNDIIHQEASNSSITKSSEFKAEMAEKNQYIENALFVDRLIKKNITDDQLKENYAVFLKEMSDKEEVKAQHILVDNEDDAKLIENKISKGESFENLAKEYSKDGSKNNGGDLGYFTKGTMVKPFEDAAFALSVGGVSSPVKSDFGWHIIKVNDKRKVTPPTFEEAKSNIENNLKKKFLDGYIEKLLKDAKFELIKQ